MGLTVMVQINDDILERMDELREAGDEGRMVAVLRSALGLYNWAHRKVRDGYSVGAFGGDKTVAELLVLPVDKGGSDCFQVLTESDAVLVVALGRFRVRCALYDQPLTTLLVEKIVAMSRSVGLVPSSTAALLESNWSGDALLEAIRVVNESGNAGHLHRLETWLAGFNIAELEAYEVPLGVTSP